MRVFKSFATNTKDGGFEKFCRAFLTKLGYECELTKASVDGGIDNYAHSNEEAIRKAGEAARTALRRVKV